MMNEPPISAKKQSLEQSQVNGKTYVFEHGRLEDIFRDHDDGVEARVRRKVLPQPLGVLDKIRVLRNPQLEGVAFLFEGDEADAQGRAKGGRDERH